MLRAAGGVSLAGYVSVLSHGADPTGVADSEAAFDAAIATGKDVYVPKGTYKISAVGGGCTLSDYQRIFGDGWQTRINYTGAGAFVSMGNFSQIDNMRIVGSGKDTGGAFLTQRAVAALIVQGWKAADLLIENIAGDDTSTGGGGIYSSGLTQVVNGDFTDGGLVSNVHCYACNVGFNFANRGEYVQAIGVTAIRGNTGAVIWGGNTKLDCNLSQNTTGLKLRSQTNDGHGVVRGMINHNTNSLDASGITNGMEFNGVFMYGGNITLTNCNGIEFIGCHLSGSGAASGTPALTLVGTCTNTQIIGGRFPTGATTGALTQTLNGNTLTTLNTLNY